MLPDCLKSDEKLTDPHNDQHC
jgi:hypothetical protein